MTQADVDIAGFAGRFAACSDVAAFWQAIRSGQIATGPLPADRWQAEAWFDAAEDVARYSTIAGGYLSDIDCFDWDFFGITQREAAEMDPQQRILLETAYHALEDAGIGRAGLSASRVGVFIGAMSTDWAQVSLQNPADLTAGTVTGNGLALLANRISYVLDLRGPCLTLDTGCSSGLVAVHQAAQAVRLDECDIAIVGAVNVVVTPTLQRFYETAGLAAADGRCKPFFDGADGIGRGEGCGVVILRRSASGHDACARLAGSAVNHNGRANGITAPSRQAQAAVIRAALSAAGAAPCNVAHVECHGTGTVLGDRIELRALHDVFGGAERRTPLPIGAVKGLIGHAEAASGMAGLIKSILMLRHGIVPAALFAGSPNPALRGQGTVELPREEAPLRSDPEACLGISAFGLGGTNAHVVLRAAPVAVQASPSKSRGDDKPAHLLVCAGPSAAAVARQHHSLKRRLAQPDTDVEALAASLRALRGHGVWRSVGVVRDATEARAHFSASARAVKASPRPVMFMFSGQGTARVGMGGALAARYEVVAATLQACDAAFGARTGRSLWPVFRGGAPALSQDTVLAQAGLVAFQLAMARLWGSFGVRPDLVLGHSIGEYAAACTAGACDLETAMVLVTERALLIAGTAGSGGMLAMEAEESAAQGLLDTTASLCVAARNTTRNIVLAGTQAALDLARRTLADRGVRVRGLDVTHAFHSPAMHRASGLFEGVAAAHRPHSLRVPMISSMTGLAMQAAPDARYWAAQMLAPVEFACACTAAAAALGQPCSALEIGPAPSLTVFAARNLAADWHIVGPARAGEDECAGFLAAQGSLWQAGVAVDLEAGQPRPVPRGCLPPYDFEPSLLPRPGRRPVGRAAAPVIASAAGSAPPELGTRHLDRLVRQLIFELVGVEAQAVDATDRLAEDLGFDSVRVIELAGRLQAALGRDRLPPLADMLDVATVGDLIERLADTRSAGRALAVQ